MSTDELLEKVSEAICICSNVCLCAKRWMHTAPNIIRSSVPRSKHIELADIVNDSTFKEHIHIQTQTERKRRKSPRNGWKRKCDLGNLFSFSFMSFVVLENVSFCPAFFFLCFFFNSEFCLIGFIRLYILSVCFSFQMFTEAYLPSHFICLKTRQWNRTKKNKEKRRSSIDSRIYSWMLNSGAISACELWASPLFGQLKKWFRICFHDEWRFNDITSFDVWTVANYYRA